MASWTDFHPTKLLELLTARGIDFVVVGGIAAIAQGSARVTHDLDICFADDPENLRSLGELLVSLDSKLRGVADEVPFTPDAATLKRIRVLTLSTAHGPLDLLVEPSGAPKYRKLLDRANRLEIGGVLVQVASLDDMMAMKRASARGKDLLDLEELEAIARLRRSNTGTVRRSSSEDKGSG